MKWNVEFYETESGDAPVEKFLDSLSVDMRAKALRAMALLEEFGSSLREPYSKPIEDGLFELRVKFAGDITRIFYFFFVDRRIVLTNGFVKKTQKTPQRELDRAKKYKRDFERRSADND